MSLLIVGSIALDSIKNQFGSVHEALGGSAVYASISASYLHDDVSIVGVAGSDFPEKHLTLLHKRGIDTTGLELTEGKTFRWSGRYEDLNEAITLQTDLNVFGKFSPKIPERLRNAKYVFLGNIDPSLQIDVLKQMKNPAIVAADTMNFWIKGEKDNLMKMLTMIDILFINEEEIRMLTKAKNLFKAAEKATDFGPETIIVKQGEYGSFVYRKDFLFFAPIYPIQKAIDTTGAGDCFAGGFLGYMGSRDKTDELTLKKATIYGTITSSFDVENFSVKGIKNISKEKIDERFDLVRKCTQFE